MIFKEKILDSVYNIEIWLVFNVVVKPSVSSCLLCSRMSLLRSLFAKKPKEEVYPSPALPPTSSSSTQPNSELNSEIPFFDEEISAESVQLKIVVIGDAGCGLHSYNAL